MDRCQYKREVKHNQDIYMEYQPISDNIYLY